MKGERVWRVVGDEHGSDNLLKRFVIVSAVAVAAGFGLSVAYSDWSGAPTLTSVFAREEAPDPQDAPPAETDRVDEAVNAPATAMPTSDEPDASLSGDWHVNTHITFAARKEFEGLALGYRLQLKQDGARLTGRGEKISENGTALAARQRTPIEVEGERDGDRVMLQFTERGARRASGGTFFLRVEDAKLRGTFASDAASSKGEVSAERVNSATTDRQKSRAR
jgi:hypothetical protein